ncbi:hypothetical protein FSP39_013877 [Pinctada imbricata]|uniref:Uncharacterized protein n=1 Tax=Pinctada imbricata TaxID=66713 RepID=A0AA88XWR2_PINIB|nr:hypothetical protein FSP39_013877 [Pinctada imbricata]
MGSNGHDDQYSLQRLAVVKPVNVCSSDMPPVFMFTVTDFSSPQEPVDIYSNDQVSAMERLNFLFSREHYMTHIFTMSKKFLGFDPRSRGRRSSLQVIPDGDEVTHFKDVDTSEIAVQKMIMKQRGRRGSLPTPKDSSPFHKPVTAMAAIDDCGFNFIEHPPYSPDLAPSDFHLFP